MIMIPFIHMNNIPKAYNPSDYEDTIYNRWETDGLFNPDIVGNTGEPFSIVLPPPNVTGTLHLGHASMLAIEDVMTRYKRMQGFDTLWLPGTDHAAIATQSVVEKKLYKTDGKTRHDLGRDAFLLKVNEFVNESKATIHKQLRKMGASMDWSREAYTLDDTRSRAVRKVFKMMYDDGLIVRGNRIVNWCPACQSTLSDDEVEHKEATALLYYFKYSKDFPFTIATTRPETKLGDTAVAVNPDDDRYKDYIGKTFEVTFVGQPLKITVIADKEVDPEFGTGALGVTPAHSMVDYEMAQKNSLEIVQVINEHGVITDAAPLFAGQRVEDARKNIVAALEKAGLMEKVEEISNNISLCYRSDTPIEPLPSKQWFIDVNKQVDRLGGMSLKEKSLEVVQDGSITFIPDRFKKVYFNWMENLHDWCISRQIWFGHQIPVWYRGAEIFVGETAPAGDGWIQDEDTLDTWFSSGLWTFSTLLNPDFETFDKENNADLLRFHPTSVLETGYDLIFFWVARMILMTTYVMGEIPFKTVYMHGLIRDKHGKKMSKSRPETAIDPLVVGDKYGYDAVRLSMLLGATPGTDVQLYEEKIENYRNFVNKLWNISRYVLMTVEDPTSVGNVVAETVADKWILSRLQTVISEVTRLLDAYQFSSAGELLRDFTWNEFADWYLEIAKVEEGKDAILMHILTIMLKLWHPFVPFVTEALWGFLGQEKQLIVAAWPKSEDALKNEQAEADYVQVQEIVSAIRNLRAENKVEPAKKIVAQFKATDTTFLKSQFAVIKALARLEEITFVDEKPAQAAATIVSGVEVYLPLADLLDLDKEKERLDKEIAHIKGYITGQEKKLGNKAFVAKAPEAVVAGEQEKLADAKEKLEKFQQQRSELA